MPFTLKKSKSKSAALNERKVLKILDDEFVASMTWRKHNKKKRRRRRISKEEYSYLVDGIDASISAENLGRTLQRTLQNPYFLQKGPSGCPEHDLGDKVLKKKLVKNLSKAMFPPGNLPKIDLLICLNLMLLKEDLALCEADWAFYVLEHFPKDDIFVEEKNGVVLGRFFKRYSYFSFEDVRDEIDGRISFKRIIFHLFKLLLRSKKNLFKNEKRLTMLYSLFKIDLKKTEIFEASYQNSFFYNPELYHYKYSRANLALIIFKTMAKEDDYEFTDIHEALGRICLSIINRFISVFSSEKDSPVWFEKTSFAEDCLEILIDFTNHIEMKLSSEDILPIINFVLRSDFDEEHHQDLIITALALLVNCVEFYSEIVLAFENGVLYQKCWLSILLEKFLSFEIIFNNGNGFKDKKKLGEKIIHASTIALLIGTLAANSAYCMRFFSSRLGNNLKPLLNVIKKYIAVNLRLSDAHGKTLASMIRLVAVLESKKKFEVQDGEI